MIELKAYLWEDSRRSGICQVVAGAVMISFSAVFVKLANVGPTTSAFYRMFFGSLLLATIVLILRKKIWSGRIAFGLMMACSLSFTIDLVLWHRSVLFVGPGLATILTNFQVFFLAAFGIIVFNEKLTFRYALSIPLSHLESNYKLGVLLGISAALAYSCYLLVLRKLQSRRESASSLSAIAVISFSTAALLAAQMGIEGGSFAIPDTVSWASLIAYGIIGHVLGWVLITRGIAKIEASRAGLVLLIQPSLSFVWDILFFHRPTGMIELFGVCLAITAIYLGSTSGKKG
jgi:drug/metabolite transporter (DMT)-like permease